MKNKLNQGFSLLEVLVFISILSLFFFSAITVSIYTMKNLRVSEQRIVATQYAQELTEFLLSEKETDWNTFLSTATEIQTNMSKNGCEEFDTLDIEWSKATLCNSTALKSELGIYSRQATFQVTPNQVIVNIIVSWSDGKGSYSVPLNTVYTE